MKSKENSCYHLSGSTPFTDRATESSPGFVIPWLSHYFRGYYRILRVEFKSNFIKNKYLPGTDLMNCQPEVNVGGIPIEPNIQG